MTNDERRMTNLSLLAWLVLVMMAAVLLLPAAVQAQGPEEMPSTMGGRANWSENCLPCHGPTGKGDGPTAVEKIEGPMPDFSDPATAHQLVPAANFETIKNGRIEKLMPPWGQKLTDAQIWDKTAYIWSLSTTPENLSAGEAIYAEQCVACHGDGGAGDGPEASATAGAEMISFADLEAMVQRSQANLQENYANSDAHADINLSDDELWNTLDYIRTFSFKVPQRDGVISGQVINATTNQPQGNIELVLHGFQDNSEILTLTTTADENGNYIFEKLPTDHTLIYAIEGKYQDIAYLGDEPGMFSPNEAPLSNIDLKVYDTTTSDEAIDITQMHYLLSFSPEAVNVIQVFVVGNSGDRTYIGQNNQTFAFDLPAEAMGVTFQNNPNNARFVETDTGYVDTEPVLPGEEGLTIAAIYDIPFFDDAITIKVPIPDDVASVDLLMQDQGIELSSDQLKFAQNRDFQGNTFSIFSSDNLNKGDTLTLNLSGLDDLEFAPPPNIPEHAAILGNSSVSQDTLLWIVLGVGGVAVVLGGVVYPMTRPKVSTADTPEVDLETRRRRLLLTLARLDQVHEAGELDEKVYQQARARYKTELVKLVGSEIIGMSN